MPLDKNRLLQLVASGETRRAITEILAQKDQITKEQYYHVIGLSAELTENEKGERDRTLSEAVLSVQKNNINKSLIALIDELDKPVVKEKQPTQISRQH